MCTGHQTAKQVGRWGWDRDRRKDFTGEAGLHRQSWAGAVLRIG